MTRGRPHRSRRRWLSRITRRILAVNVLALAILVAGLLYLGEYRRGLIAQELAALRTQANMFAAALGEGAVATSGDGLVREMTRNIVRRLVETTGVRARLFDFDGGLITDSRLLIGPGGMVQIEELPPPDTSNGLLVGALDIYDRLIRKLPGYEKLPQYTENAVQHAGDYGEAAGALFGQRQEVVRAVGDGMVLSVAVPVQRYKQVLGALMLSRGSHDIDAALYQVRLDILKVFAVALAVTVALSLYLAGTIARPIRLLAAAAERVRTGRDRRHTIPDLSARSDEIGDLAEALKDMTEALWQRLDAIENFAADVAHEIKNPLTSLRSAVETAARITDQDQQRKLMTIIHEDVQRLDRLISDISDASRLDAELSRAEQGPVDVGAMLATMVDVYVTSRRDHQPVLRLEQETDMVVTGMEGRLAQVFRNLIANAVSFSPPGATIAIRAGLDGGWFEITVEDEGPGIPEGKEDAIFDRFYSERPEREKFGTHSGLGLSISKQIIEAHGGTLRAENRHAGDGGIVGARFVTRLPAG